MRDHVTRHRTRPAAQVLMLSVLVLAAACGGQDGATADRPAGSPAPTVASSGGADRTQNGTIMQVRIVVDGTELHGTLEDTPVARDFAALLPVTLTLSDFHRTERIADLPRRLDTAGAPSGTAAQAGDITYYAPWGNLALFYRDAGHADGLVRLGHLRGEAADVLAGLDEGTTATITRADD
jgi:hypothetical protein